MKMCCFYTGKLTKADKEMIIVATSAANNCLYCIIAHGALHRIYSKNALLADQVYIRVHTMYIHLCKMYTQCTCVPTDLFLFIF